MGPGGSSETLTVLQVSDLPSTPDLTGTADLGTQELAHFLEKGFPENSQST